MKKIISAMMVFAMLFAFAACSDGPSDENETSQPESGQSEVSVEKETFTELTIDSIEEQGEIVVVKTSYCTVSFPYAFSDLVGVTAETFEESASLAFSVRLGGEEYPSYTLTFNGSEGILIGKMEIESEDTAVPVYVEFHEAAENLDEGEINTFNAVMETFNDVIVSLCENANFVPEE